MRRAVWVRSVYREERGMEGNALACQFEAFSVSRVRRAMPSNAVRYVASSGTFTFAPGERNSGMSGIASPNPTG